ncbi:MAG TPA: monofunctional biosynthetic peptidoglycan transglycosylase [Rhizomicrobium sp.]|jgi:monofunctional biosynthetic peptidoglycan transglycosylase|nr:monofunctional biosynthetic peptidoglycan transglycosylase [Rhizomicrobium sp.]
MAAVQSLGKPAARSRGRARSSFLRWLGRILFIFFILLVPLPALLLLIFRAVPVPATPQMLASWLEGDGAHYGWVDMNHISPGLARAVIASEDQKFCSHHGFDWGSIDSATQIYAEGGRLRGASTISQQTARSLLLFPVRSWIRKGLEAWITVLEEALWPKRRILTVYLNVVDWGHGNFGAGAAARAYFHRTAAALSLRQTARLAAVLPDPDKWRAVQPGPYVAARTALILRRMGEVRRDRLDSCLRP